MRKRFFTADFDLGPDLPAQFEMVAKEGSDGTEGLVDGAASEVALGLEVEQEVESLPAF